MIAKLKTWLRPTNFAWTKWEMVLARLAIAGLLFYFGCLTHLKPFETSPEKLNGLAKLVPLMWMLDPSALLVIRVVSVIGLVMYVIGWMPVLSFLPGLFTMLGMGALRNSKGDIGHSTQVLAMGALTRNHSRRRNPA